MSYYSPDEENETQQKWLLEKSGLSTVQDLSKLTKLNLPNCDLSSLPSNLPTILPNLSILFCPKNKFEELPAVVGECPNLQMVSFKDNGMTRIHPDALQPQLRWLILTGNAIKELPKTIGRCKKLQKLMLSGNVLEDLPESISQLENLELVRLACNQLQKPPLALLRLPNLRWAAFARNPFLEGVANDDDDDDDNDNRLVTLTDSILQDTTWPVLGQGAGGITRKVTWETEDKKHSLVAVKTFAGELTSDGSPQDERAISVAAASLKDSSLIQLLGQTNNGSLVMEFLQGYEALAEPPSLDTCSRDVYAEDRNFTEGFAWNVAINLLQVLQKLHQQKGICHGDFYGHNILICQATQTVKLSDFGAAFFYDTDAEYGKLIQRVELRAYSVLVDELQGVCSTELSVDSRRRWKELADACKDVEASSFHNLVEKFQPK